MKSEACVILLGVKGAGGKPTLVNLTVTKFLLGVQEFIIGVVNSAIML